MAVLPARMVYAEKIEQTVDDMIDVILSDNNIAVISMVETDMPVSAETWLACKARLLALVATVTGQQD